MPTRKSAADRLESYVRPMINFFALDARLSPQQLKRLVEHKYCAQDNSILDKLIMQKFWNKIVAFYPLWVAPNLITIVGLLMNISAVLVLACFNSDGTRDAPFWTYLFCALTLFIYQTLDATDGKQARRTNTCSPLGELFDHGCDSLSQVFVALEICLSIKLGHFPALFLFMCVFAEAMFYCAHWQTYVSGMLTFGKFDVTEAQFVVISLCIITAVFGSDFWAYEVFPNFELRIIFVIVGLLMACLSSMRYFNIIFTGGVGKNGSTVAGTSILYPVLPMLAFIVPQIVIYSRSESDHFTQNLVVYCILFGVISAKVTTKLVVAHMSKSALTLWDTIFYGPIILGLNQYLGTILSEKTLLFVCTAYCIINFLCYAKELCDIICAYMKIECFRIPVVEQPNGMTSSRRMSNTKSIVDGKTH